MEVFGNIVGRVDHLRKSDLILLTLFSEAVGLELRELLVATMEHMKKHAVTRLITDYSSKTPLSADDQHWMSWTWFPAMAAHHWHYWAIVRPVNPVAAMGLTQIVESATQFHVAVAQFENVQAARRWMDQKREPSAV